jgi:hypothetical protein
MSDDASVFAGSETTTSAVEENTIVDEPAANSVENAAKDTTEAAVSSPLRSGMGSPPARAPHFMGHVHKCPYFKLLPDERIK